MRTDLDENKDYIIESLKNGASRAAICREFNCKYDTLRARLEKWGVDHLKNQSGRGIKKPKVPVIEYLNDYRLIRTHALRLKLIEEGYKEHKCEVCQHTEWNGEPIPLELHHVNGIHHDNHLENLQILCPNCHAQTPNHAGKGRKDRKIKQPKTPRDRSKGAKVKQEYVKRKTCLDCETLIDSKATRCKSCAQKALGRTKIDWPPTETLIQMVESSSYLAVGRELGVSDNAVRKRIKNYS